MRQSSTCKRSGSAPERPGASTERSERPRNPRSAQERRERPERPGAPKERSRAARSAQERLRIAEERLRNAQEHPGGGASLERASDQPREDGDGWEEFPPIHVLGPTPPSH